MIDVNKFIQDFNLEECVVEKNNNQFIIDLDDCDLFNNVIIDLDDANDFYLEESTADSEYAKFIYNKEDTDIIVSANFNDDKYLVVLKEQSYND